MRAATSTREPNADTSEPPASSPRPATTAEPTKRSAGRAALRRIRSNRTAFLQRRLERLDADELETLRAALPVLAALAEDDPSGAEQ